MMLKHPQFLISNLIENFSETGREYEKQNMSMTQKNS